MRENRELNEFEPDLDEQEDISDPHYKILLVEDSSVVVDLVVLILGQAGHEVLSAEDGATALQLLDEHNFDVVLCDFHLPDITGLEVVNTYREKYGNANNTRFIAVTADVRGLLTDSGNCEVFDRVIPKPLDIDRISEIVTEEVKNRNNPAPVRVANGKMRARSTIEALPFEYSYWPLSSQLSTTAGSAGADAILVTDAHDVLNLWSLPGSHLLPIIDLTGEMGAMCDLDAKALKITDENRVGELINAFRERREEMHPNILSSDDPLDRLLCRIHLSGGELQPQHSGAVRSMIRWNTLLETDDILPLVDRLSKEHLIETEFFDRLHHCPDCSSARLIVREECPSCKSAQLEEQSYLHHFRCAYQGPESDFLHGDDLQCPKCRRKLAHFGTDYDRPGLMLVCEGCASTTSEPHVAFSCSDCGSRSESFATPTVDILAARITDAGIAYLHSGRGGMKRNNALFRFSDLPLDLVVSLNKAASAYNADQTPFVLGQITYDAYHDIRAQSGARHANDARRVWFETFRQAMNDRVIFGSGSYDDYFLLNETSPDQAEQKLEGAQANAGKSIRFDLQASVRLFAPEDIAG